jgi:hypothetical protein
MVSFEAHHTLWITFPGRKNRKEEIVYDQEEYKKRGLIERIFGKLKENHRLDGTV